jgi:hypothetical protein
MEKYSWIVDGKVILPNNLTEEIASTLITLAKVHYGLEEESEDKSQEILSEYSGKKY